MVSAINVYYTNKSAQSIVDLKMNSKLWLKAKRVNIQPAQQEVKIEFQLPIIACNLMIEYADFYERDAQTHTETTILQCPRCSASVPAHPGVCNTCGENVFQCHKCRSINYDERDPFLCNSCGFCKFAKFDFTLVGRQCCAVDPIESEEDRKQTLQTISSLLERADKIYNTLSQQTKPTLEALIVKLNEQNVIEKFLVTPQPPAPFGSNSAQPQQQIINGSGDLQQINLITNPSSASSNPGGIIGIKVTTLNNNNNNSNNVSAAQISGNVASHTTPYNLKTIQSIVQKYSVECKNKFDDLSKIILKLNLCRKELREYDRQFKTFNWNSSQTNVSSTSTSSTITRKNSIAFDAFAQQQQQQQQQPSTGLMMSSASLIWNQNFRNKCYGCASASIEHCINLFRALICSNSSTVFVSGQQPSPFSSSCKLNWQLIFHLNLSLIRLFNLLTIILFNNLKYIFSQV
jgi:E3 ubiquitin-protein ligase UBR4